MRILAAVIAIAAGAAAGHLLGASGRPDAETARALERAVAGATYPRAYAAAFAERWREGFLDGAADGVIAGERAGRRAAEAELARRADTAAERAERVTEAEPLPPLPTAAPPETGRVLVVGDSLEVLTSPYLQRYLPGVDLEIKAHGGFSSPMLYDVFERAYDPSFDVVVFDAGTNDSPLYPQILAGRLQAVADVVGDRCLVVPTIHSYVVDGIGDEGKNRVVRAFAASRPGTQTPDWQAAVAAHPEAMQPDNLHPNAEGADLRARLIAEGVQACLALGEGFG